MKKYCSDIFKSVLDISVKKGIEIDGIVFSTKDALYNHIAGKLNVSEETVKKWAGHNNKGPREQFLVDKLEKMFNTPLRITVDEAIQYTRYPDIVKSSVSKIIGDFIDLVYGDIEDEEQYWALEDEMHRFKPTIPPPLYRALDEFQQKSLIPFIFRTKETVPQAFSELCGYWNEKNQFCVTDNELHFSALFEKVEEIKAELDKIIETKVHPIIFNM